MFNTVCFAPCFISVPGLWHELRDVAEVSLWPFLPSLAIPQWWCVCGNINSCPRRYFFLSRRREFLSTFCSSGTVFRITSFKPTTMTNVNIQRQPTTSWTFLVPDVHLAKLRNSRRLNVQTKSRRDVFDLKFVELLGTSHLLLGWNTVTNEFATRTFSTADHQFPFFPNDSKQQRNVARKEIFIMFTSEFYV